MSKSRLLMTALLALLVYPVKAVPLNHSENFLPEKKMEELLQRSLDHLASARKPTIEVDNKCESPTLPSGAFHILVQAHKPKTCVNQWLWELGVTNAHVFIYRRVDAKAPLRTWHGPCGMFVQERILTPNHNREVPVYLDYVLEHYENPPAAVAVLHWRGAQDWHNSCAGTLGRVRYAYRGLASPQRWPDAAEYASHMTTLTRAAQEGDVLPLNLSLRFLHYPQQAKIPSWTAKPAHDIERNHKHCASVFGRYGVDVAAKTFYSCCATFVLPWKRILSLPEAFYRDLLEVALSDETVKADPEFGWVCWEFAVWQWYKEPELTPRMESLYLQAQNVSSELDLSRCLTPVPEAEMHTC